MTPEMRTLAMKEAYAGAGRGGKSDVPWKGWCVKLSPLVCRTSYCGDGLVEAN